MMAVVDSIGHLKGCATMIQSRTNDARPDARRAFIDAMRIVANSVTVVTTDGPGGLQGATVSAFSSVSADPPTILVCLRSQSRIAQAVAENGAFCVNVLPQYAQEIAERFAGGQDARFSNRFEGIGYECEPGSLPILHGATAFLCGIEQIVTSGSHRIFIGQVRNVRRGAPEPLTYFDGGYHRVVPQNAVTDCSHPSSRA